MCAGCVCRCRPLSGITSRNAPARPSLHGQNWRQQSNQLWSVNGKAHCCQSDSGSIMSSMNLGFSEMLFLFLLALIIFGPKKMPEIGRQIGKALNDLKRASNEFKAQIESEIANIEREVTPQILPPSEPPRSTVASGTLVDVPAVEHVPAQLTPPSDSSPKAPD